jgi:chondroitin 4-sulfotransferase 11
MGSFYIRSPKELSYVHIPRTGLGMKAYITKYLKEYTQLNDSDTWMINHPNLKTVKLYYPDAKSLSVVRNPWQRIYSFYTIVTTDLYWDGWSSEHFETEKDFNKWIAAYADPEVDFQFPRWFDRFTNMYEFLIDDDGNYADFILKAETLEEDFKQVQDYLGLDQPLPNITEFQNHYEYRNYYSSESAEVIRKMFEKDCELFKYVY